jgi:hypothetical protein
VLNQTPLIKSIKMLFRSLLVGLPLTAALPGLLPKVGSLVKNAVGAVVGAPTITLDYGTFKGHSLYLGVDSFLGMPFAKAGRLENPRLVNSKQDKLEGVQDATSYGDACPQTEFIGLTSSTEVSLILV